MNLGILNRRRLTEDAFDFTTGLVASYQFETGDGSTHVDYTGNNDATITGVVNIVTGQVGNCANFIGNVDYLTIADSDDFSFTDGVSDIPFSICFWVNFDDLTGNPRIMLKEDTISGNREWRLFYSTGATEIIFLLIDKDTSGLLRVGIVATPSTGTWYHHAITYDGSELDSGLKFYKNGVDSGTSSTIGTYNRTFNTAKGVTIGANDAGGSIGNELNGKLDEIKFYRDRELTASEVLEMYTRENIGLSVL